MKMDYSKLSTSALKDLHEACVRAYKSDRDLESVARELESWRGQYFGVDEFPDWNEQVKQIEAELTDRKETFNPIELR